MRSQATKVVCTDSAVPTLAGWWLTLDLLLSCVMVFSLQSTNWAWFRILQMKMSIYCSLLSLYRLKSCNSLSFLDNIQKTMLDVESSCSGSSSLITSWLWVQSITEMEAIYKTFYQHNTRLALVNYTGHSVSHPSNNQIYLKTFK